MLGSGWGSVPRLEFSRCDRRNAGGGPWVCQPPTHPNGCCCAPQLDFLGLEVAWARGGSEPGQVLRGSRELIAEIKRHWLSSRSFEEQSSPVSCKEWPPWGSLLTCLLPTFQKCWESGDQETLSSMRKGIHGKSHQVGRVGKKRDRERAGP